MNELNAREELQSLARARLLTISRVKRDFFWDVMKRYMVLGDDQSLKDFEQLIPPRVEISRT